MEWICSNPSCVHKLQEGEHKMFKWSAQTRPVFPVDVLAGLAGGVPNCPQWDSSLSDMPNVEPEGTIGSRDNGVFNRPGVAGAVL